MPIMTFHFSFDMLLASSARERIILILAQSKLAGTHALATMCMEIGYPRSVGVKRSMTETHAVAWSSLICRVRQETLLFIKGEGRVCLGLLLTYLLVAQFVIIVDKYYFAITSTNAVAIASALTKSLESLG